mgnify:CR=1 FL=1
MHSDKPLDTMEVLDYSRFLEAIECYCRLYARTDSEINDAFGAYIMGGEL